MIDDLIVQQQLENTLTNRVSYYRYTSLSGGGGGGGLVNVAAHLTF